jgi:hypothetical protein
MMVHRNDVSEGKDSLLVWLVRIVIAIVFLANISAAVAFILQPSRYAPGFEVEGIPGRAIVQGIGILFLMWNVTYPLVIMNPIRYMTIFAIILAQQTIGVVGESWIYLTLPVGHAALRQTGLRFILFDGGGLLAMLLMYLWLWRTIRAEQELSRNKDNP